MKAISGRPLTSSVTSQLLPSDGGRAVIETFFLFRRLNQGRIVGRIDREGLAIGVMAGDLRAGDRHVLDPTLIDVGQKLAVVDLLGGDALAGLLEQHDQSHDQQNDDHPKGEIPEIRIHLFLA